jgi:small GTP-binding protein
MNEEEFDYMLKVVIIGDSGVGKTNLLYRFTKNKFNIDSRATIGVDFSAKNMRVNDLVVKTQFWDTAG